MARKFIILEKTNGDVEEMRDHTDWFVEQMGETGVKGYHQTTIDAAIRRAGGINYIKRLARWHGNDIVETFVLLGTNMLKLNTELGVVDHKKLSKAVCEFVHGLLGHSPSQKTCDAFAVRVFAEIRDAS